MIRNYNFNYVCKVHNINNKLSIPYDNDDTNLYEVFKKIICYKSGHVGCILNMMSNTEKKTEFNYAIDDKKILKKELINDKTEKREEPINIIIDVKPSIPAYIIILFTCTTCNSKKELKLNTGETIYGETMIKHINSFSHNGCNSNTPPIILKNRTYNKNDTTILSTILTGKENKLDVIINCPAKQG
jgi:hypothetical protein